MKFTGHIFDFILYASSIQQYTNIQAKMIEKMDIINHVFVTYTTTPKVHYTPAEIHSKKNQTWKIEMGKVIGI